MLHALPLLSLDEACVAEARRAISADDVFGAPLAAADDALVQRLLLFARVLPVAMDALGEDPELFVRARLGAPALEGPLPGAGAPLAAAAAMAADRSTLDVKVWVAVTPTDAEPAKLVSGEAAVLCRVKFPLVIDNAGEDGEKVLIQRFGSNSAATTRRTGGGE